MVTLLGQVLGQFLSFDPAVQHRVFCSIPGFYPQYHRAMTHTHKKKPHLRRLSDILRNRVITM